MCIFDGIKLDNYTYPFVFKAIGGLGDGKVYGFALKCGDVFDSYICNLVMDMMRKDRIRADEATLASTLSACVGLRDVKLGKEIHGYVRDKIGFTIIDNALLDMYYEARRLFDESPVKDIVLWTTMINGFVQFNHVDEAMRLFQQMQKFKIKPDNFTVVALLTGCAQVGALEQRNWIHKHMNERRISIDAVCGTALIDMYAKCDCVDKSLEVFYGLHDKDTASWTSIICALSVNGKTSKALESFTEMKESGLRSDDITFIGVLNACSHRGLVEEGWKHFKSMKLVYQIEPKIEHYGVLN
nr:hypothetical protein [Tanacetum cinerariifolium]